MASDTRLGALTFDDGPSAAARPAWRGWALLAALVVLSAILGLSGAYRLVSFTALVEDHAVLKSFVAASRLTAALVYLTVYAASVAVSVPLAAAFTLLGGFLFGGFAGGALAVVAQTLGAAGMFALTRTAIGGALAERAGPMLRRFGRGFRDGAWSYLLVLRFIPVVPFWLVNLAPALFPVRFHVFVATTFVGVIPTAMALAIAGSAFADAVESEARALAACRASGRAGCVAGFDLAAALTPELLLALGVLAGASLLPLAAKLRRAL